MSEKKNEGEKEREYELLLILKGKCVPNASAICSNLILTAYIIIDCVLTTRHIRMTRKSKWNLFWKFQPSHVRLDTDLLWASLLKVYGYNDWNWRNISKGLVTEHITFYKVWKKAAEGIKKNWHHFARYKSAWLVLKWKFQLKGRVGRKGRVLKGKLHMMKEIKNKCEWNKNYIFNNIEFVA